VRRRIRQRGRCNCGFSVVGEIARSSEASARPARTGGRSIPKLHRKKHLQHSVGAVERRRSKCLSFSRLKVARPKAFARPGGARSSSRGRSNGRVTESHELGVDGWSGVDQTKGSETPEFANVHRTFYPRIFVPAKPCVVFDLRGAEAHSSGNRAPR
jgi:hypothetical protein